MHAKHILCLALAAATAFSCTIPAGALSNVTNWAQADVSAAKQAGLEPASLANAKATGSITRAEFCEVSLKLYEIASGKTAPKAEEKPFTDTSSAAVAAAAGLGLVTGRGNGVFDPSGAVTRQELCKILDNILAAASQKPAATDPEALGDFPDQSAVASWAREPVARMLGEEILRGISRSYNDPTGETVTITELKPAGTTTREQALIIALRFSQKYKTQAQDKPNVSGGPDIADPDADTSDGGTTINSGGSSTEVPTDVPSSLPKTKEEKMAFVFGTGGTFFATPEIAEAAMTQISIPVWRLNSGKKTEGKAYVTVNRNLAAIYTTIFIEIFNGSEKFPISDVGSYAWRPSPTSEHRWGTAIDINYDANMEATINADGTMTPTTGTHWTPGEDPLSIPENGDVYNAFTKYGFSWGGNAWRSKRDYMHFSYFGT